MKEVYDSVTDVDIAYIKTNSKKEVETDTGNNNDKGKTHTTKKKEYYFLLMDGTVTLNSNDVPTGKSITLILKEKNSKEEITTGVTWKDGETPIQSPHKFNTTGAHEIRAFYNNQQVSFMTITCNRKKL